MNSGFVVVLVVFTVSYILTVKSCLVALPNAECRRVKAEGTNAVFVILSSVWQMTSTLVPVEQVVFMETSVNSELLNNSSCPWLNWLFRPFTATSNFVSMNEQTLLTYRIREVAGRRLCITSGAVRSNIALLIVIRKIVRFTVFSVYYCCGLPLLVPTGFFVVRSGGDMVGPLIRSKTFVESLT